MLNSFYKCTLIVSRIIQIDIYLRFYIFKYMFDHLKKLKNIIIINITFLHCTIVIKACQATLNKLSKYYSKTKDWKKIIYNIIYIFSKS